MTMSIVSQTVCRFFIFVAVILLEAHGLGENVGHRVVYAVNCGGEAHVDVFGVKYAKDSNRVGTASDYGKQLLIARSPAPDQTLYQTERYHTATFGYDIPVKEDGSYLLILKFSEVYFNGPNMKVFDVVLNGDLTIASDFDIFERVGRGTAYDEYIEFEVMDGKIHYEGDESEITGGKIRVEFIKSYRDNPKVNAIVLAKGRLEDWPKLPPLQLELEEEENQEPVNEALNSELKKIRNPSGPKVKDPYESDDTTAMLPILVALGAFIPLVICLCKL